MKDTAKVTIRLDANGGLLEVDVEGHNPTTDLVEERKSEPTPSFDDHSIRRNWLAGG